MRAGSVLLVLSHFQPRLLTTPRSWPRAGFEAQFDPEAQGVPAGSGVLRRQVGEDDPRFFLLDVPDRQQGAAAFCGGGTEGGAAANPSCIGTGNEVLCGQPAAVLGAEADVLPIPHVGMPAPRSGRGQALSAYLSPQLGTGDAPVAEHDDGHFPGNRRGQFPEQFHRGIHPGAALVSRAAAKHTTVAERKCTTGVMPEGADLGVGVATGTVVGGPWEDYGPACSGAEDSVAFCRLPLRR